jgi:transposase
MHYLGVDWSVEKNDLCLLADDGRILSELSIPSGNGSFQALHKLLDGLDEVAINIERPDGLLVDWLAARAHTVYVTSPTIVARRRPRRSKDDRGDAYLLARLLRLQDPDCRPLVRQSQVVIHLRLLVKAYDDVVEEHRRETTRLVWLLRDYYPAMLQAFRSRNSKIFLTFLEAFPTPEEARRLSREELVAFLRGHSYGHSYRFGPIYAALQTPSPTAFAEDAFVEVVQLQIPRMRYLFEQRAHLRERIATVFKTHPEAAWWRSFPGTSGPLTPARLLAAIGDDRGRFPSAQVLQATAGTVPITRRSGKQTRVAFRQACSRPMRRAVADLARFSIKHSGWAQGYFYDQLARGHSKSRAYRALGNRWLSIIWKLWQTGERYDEAKHVANRARRGQPVPA